MTPKTLNRNSSKWSEVKIFFILDLFLTKCVRIISCYKMLSKNSNSGDFSIKSNSFHLSMAMFLCILDGWESYIALAR
jgi:hypothetical protein